MAEDVEQTRRALTTLQANLRQIATADPEQEVRGPPIAAVDAALSVVRDSAVVSKVHDIISPETIEAGDPVRAVDVLLVVGILLSALPGEEGPDVLPGTSGS
jgi:hypothetical protein